MALNTAYSFISLTAWPLFLTLFSDADAAPAAAGQHLIILLHCLHQRSWMRAAEHSYIETAARPSAFPLCSCFGDSLSQAALLLGGLR